LSYPIKIVAYSHSLFGQEHVFSRSSMSSQPQLDSSQGRLLSLDVLRGFDMFWIVFGEVAVWSLAEHTDWRIFEWMFAELTHPEWHGFTFYDLVFPLFMFIAGVSFPFSMASRLDRGESLKDMQWHILRRGLILILLGLLRKQKGLLTLNFAAINYTSVLGRIGIAYVCGTLIAMHTSWRGRIGWSVGLLLGYWAAIEWVPVPVYGAGDLEPGHTLACYLDNALLPGKGFAKHCSSEGILGTFTATVNVLAGVMAGEWLRRAKNTDVQKAVGLLVAGIVAWGVGKLWGEVLPINKYLWTSSFAMLTIGWSLLLLGLFYLVVDVWKVRRGMLFFVVIGVNPLVIYMADGFVDFHGIAEVVLGDDIGKLHPVLADCSGCVLGWLILYYLYRKKIFWRV